MPDFDARAFIDSLEWEWNRAEIRRKLLVRKAGDDNVVIDEGEIRDGIDAVSFVGGGVRQRGFRMLDVVEGDFFKLSRRVDADDHRSCRRSAAARYGKIDLVRDRIDREVIDEDLIGCGSQHSCNFRID